MAATILSMRVEMLPFIICCDKDIWKEITHSSVTKNLFIMVKKIKTNYQKTMMITNRLGSYHHDGTNVYMIVLVKNISPN